MNNRPIFIVTIIDAKDAYIGSIPFASKKYAEAYIRNCKKQDKSLYPDTSFKYLLDSKYICNCYL